MRQILVSVSLFLLACTSSDAVGYAAADRLPRDFLGESHRAWLAGQSLFVEIEQIAGFNVADIECAISGQDLHLSPIRISSGGSGKTTFEIVLPESHSADRAEHLFWVTHETFTPIWLGRPTEPTERVRLLLEPMPSDAPAIRRPTRRCS